MLSDFREKRSELERFSVIRREISLERAWKVAMMVRGNKEKIGSIDASMYVAVLATVATATFDSNIDVVNTHMPSVINPDKLPTRLNYLLFQARLVHSRLFNVQVAIWIILLNIKYSVSKQQDLRIVAVLATVATVASTATFDSNIDVVNSLSSDRLPA
jgi:hypothetical protein